MLVLNESRILSLMKNIPKFASIDLNIDRETNMSLDSTVFSAFLALPALEKITLRVPTPDYHCLVMSYHDLDDAGYYDMRKNYEYGGRDEKDIPDPMFNQDTVSKLFHETRERKTGDNLKEMEFYVGNWESMYDRGMFPNIIVRVAHWRCVAEGEKENCEGSQTRVIE